MVPRPRGRVAATLGMSLLLVAAVAVSCQQQNHASATSHSMPAAASSPSSSASSSTSTAAINTTKAPSSSSSTVCPSLDRSPTVHHTLVVTSSTYALADGSSLEGMLSVNGTIVGPTLEFEDGQDVSIDVVNNIGGNQNTSIHWHGVDVPGAAWADGVTGITQNAIPDGVTFRYRFKATPVGTHWYHAHTGLLYANGLRGALIIRPKGGKPRSKSDVGVSYDEERIFLVSDQAATTAEKVLEELELGGMNMITMNAGGAGAHGGEVVYPPAPRGGELPAAAGAGNAAAHGGMSSSMPSPPASGAGAAAHGRRKLLQMAGMEAEPMAPAAAPAPAAAAAAAAAHSAMAGMTPAAPAPSAAAHSAAAANASAPAMVAEGEQLPDPQSGCFNKTTTQDISDAPYYATLVNGKGFALSQTSKEGNNSSMSSPFVGSPAVITVKKGKKYRFRLINGGASWGYNVSVERHPMTLLALDGYPLAVSKNRKDKKTKKVDALVTTPGETVDFLIDATAPDGIRNYWIDVLTLTGYGGPAVLHYEGAPDPLSPEGKKALGPPPTFKGCEYARDRSPRVADLKNATGLFLPADGPKPPKGAADRTLALYLTPNFSPPESGGAPPSNFSEAVTGFFSSFFGGSNKTSTKQARLPPRGGCPLLADGKPSAYCWGTNWVTFKAPETPPIFEGKVKGGNGSTSPLADAAAAATAASAAAAANGDYSDYRIPLPSKAVVDLIYINPSAMVHPMHIHGLGGWLLASGNGKPPTKDGLLDTSDPRVNLVDPPRRSTIPVANAVPGVGDGFAVFRFVVDNVGPFPHHCHIDYHAEAFMLQYFIFGGEDMSGNPVPAAWEIPPGLDCEEATASARAKNATAPSPVMLNPFEDKSWSIPQLK